MIGLNLRKIIEFPYGNSIWDGADSKINSGYYNQRLINVFYLKWDLYDTCSEYWNWTAEAKIGLSNIFPLTDS